jgi:hypothetical protein
MALGRSARFAAAALALLLAACEEVKPPQGRMRVVAAEPDQRAGWLSPRDRVDPAVWLAARVGGGRPASDEAVERMRRALDGAQGRVLESPRMLANRAAQLSDMLSAAGMREDLADLVGSLGRAAGMAAAKQTFGELCQHYLNLRRQGRSGEEALAALAERYALQKRDP